MRCPFLIAVLTLLSMLAFSSMEASGDENIELAPGLRIELIADDDMVPDCTTLAVDNEGRIIASGPGYLRMLLDDDGNGHMDRAITLTQRPSHGAHGICLDGTSLYFVGDGGIWRLDDSDGDSIADTEPTMILPIKTGGEHDAHALRIGPDGHWYLIAGNGAETMFAIQNIANPSVPNPRAGVIWRISPDWSTREVWAHGFRNAYDFDFASDHSIVTFDSDGERDVSLPWYRPTRVFRVRQGDDAGWMSRSWKRPDCDPQMPEVLAEFGRGSPTGVMRSTGNRLPARFDHGVFVLDWTFGRVLFVSDQGDSELVARPTGTAGLAVTDIAALPDGRIVISVGGRRSRGGIYLIDAIAPRAENHAEFEMWSGQPPMRPENHTRQWITRLRNQKDRQLDSEAATHAKVVLQDPSSHRGDWIAATTLLIESVGGLGAGDPKDARGEWQAAPVFDSCRSILRPLLEPELINELTETLIGLIESNVADLELKNELIRALAVIEPDSVSAFACVMTDLEHVASPTDKLHRLIALARLPVKHSDDMTEQLAEAMLQIPRMIEQTDCKIDQNWTPRLGELFVALEHRDSLLPSRLVAIPDFGQPADLVWTERMDPENLERARQRMLSNAGSQLMNPRIARFIAVGDDAIPQGFIRNWLAEPTTRAAGWLATASHARSSDVETLREAALSVDATVREAAAAALVRLGEDVPVRISNSQAIQEWLAKVDQISQLQADPSRGKDWFQQRQCAGCHNGAKALGPSLEGISKRFGTDDLFRSTVDPNHTIPDRYRAKKVLTADGQIVIGMPIYESVDGVTLITAEATMKRINDEEIVEMHDSDVSLMPEGLLDGMSDLQVAELLAYLRTQ